MAWNVLVTTGQGPGPRDSHSAVVVGHKMIVFGGTNGSKKVNDLHVLDLQTRIWARPECQGTPPSPRESHTATLVGRDKVVVFGGSGEGEANYLNDLHVLDLKSMSWTSPKVEGRVPSPRDSHCAFAIDHNLFVYGGDCGDRHQGEVDVLDLDTLTWSTFDVRGPSPGVRAGHACVTYGSKVYIIGGVGDKQYYNDVWELDVINRTWTEIETRGEKPQGRFSHTASILTPSSNIAIFGGCGEDERPLNELLVLQLRAEPDNASSSSLSAGSRSCENLMGYEEGKMCSRKIEELFTKSAKKMALSTDAKRVLSLESMPSFIHNGLETLHPKRRRMLTNPDMEEEEEDEDVDYRSLSLSNHSSNSSSQSDQEPATSATVMVGRPVAPKHDDQFPLFRRKSSPPNKPGQPSYLGGVHKVDLPNPLPVFPVTAKGLQLVGLEHLHGLSRVKPLEVGQSPSLIGAEIHGKVDGAFDSGYLMTATVNGKVFRGVLFPPGPGLGPQGPVLGPNHHLTAPPVTQTAHLSVRRQAHPAVQLSGGEDVYQRFRTVPGKRRSGTCVRAPPPLKEPSHGHGRDVQDVVLSLGGPGLGHA
ncbi:unnamed protein product [Cuscuta campestris]|uniref:Uncharacterized protein n=1 Tax=Cuscuta campestris TaxID=132261 RepID=A0A484M7Y1_9ASTE|nr:unnamed protein product [Cuscuta campestris]